ncbi:MAG: TlpA disulfide reductase family protein [Puia sp.]|nr:TlpA disulfide reductase family protein [Puia sp.]
MHTTSRFPVRRGLHLLLLTAVLTAAVGLTGFSQSRPKAGQPAPDVSLPGPDGKTVKLSDLKGTVVLIDFWASWCGPCRRNNPHLVKLYKKYHGKGLEILGVSLDEKDQDWKTAVQQDGLGWLQVNDNKGWNASSAASYGVDAIPASFLIDKEGVVRGVDLVGWDLESAIKKLLK